MALVKKVKDIIKRGDAIQLLGLFSRPAAYEELVRNDITPVLLEIAEFIDSFAGEPLPGEVSVATVLNEFQEKLNAVSQQSAAVQAENAELKQEIVTLKGRVTKLQKSTTEAPAAQEVAA